MIRDSKRPLTAMIGEFHWPIESAHGVKKLMTLTKVLFMIKYTKGTYSMRTIQYAVATCLGGTLAFVTLLSLKTLGPRWENNPTAGPLLAAISLTAAYWLAVTLLRRYTPLVPVSGKYILLAVTTLAWALAYTSVKGHDDPPLFAFLGPVIWLPALLIYGLPVKGAPARAE